MTTKINGAHGVEFTSSTPAVEKSKQETYDFNFNSNGDLDKLLQAKITKENVDKTLKANKNNFELHVPWIGEDYIKFAGDGKMTYGQLREQLGIPPKVLSETNGKKLTDDQIVKDTRINLSDIGWFEVPMSESEAAVFRSQRDYGNHYAGYERAVTNDHIKQLLK